MLHSARKVGYFQMVVFQAKRILHHRFTWQVRLVALACSLIFGLLLWIADAAAQSPDESERTEPVFVPPDIGTPADRAGAGTREVAQNEGPIRLFVPEGGGLTTLATPPLIWELTVGFRGTIRSEVGTRNGAGVVFEQSGAYPRGRYGLDLERSNLRLKEGAIYHWHVELLDEGTAVARSETLIERVAPDGRTLGAAGLWFDVMEGMVSIDLSGRARVSNPTGFDALLTAGGLAP